MMDIIGTLMLFIQDAAPVVQSTAEAAVQSVQETATVVSMQTDAASVVAQFSSAYATVFVLKFIRKYIPALQANAKTINKIIAGFSAFLVSMGISWTFNIVTVDEASRVLNIAITFPTMVALMNGMWGWASQYVFQQVHYKWFIVSNEHQVIISEQIANATGKPRGVEVTPPGIVTDK